MSQSSRKNSVEEAIVLMSNTLEYLITVQNKKKTPFHIAYKKEQFDVVLIQFQAFSINLNAQHVNGMTPFDSYPNTCTDIRYSYS